jgi:hypothetical protein
MIVMGRDRKNVRLFPIGSNGPATDRGVKPLLHIGGGQISVFALTGGIAMQSN